MPFGRRIIVNFLSKRARNIGSPSGGIKRQFCPISFRGVTARCHHRALLRQAVNGRKAALGLIYANLATPGGPVRQARGWPAAPSQGASSRHVASMFLACSSHVPRIFCPFFPRPAFGPAACRRPLLYRRRRHCQGYSSGRNVPRARGACFAQEVRGGPLRGEQKLRSACVNPSGNGSFISWHSGCRGLG